MVLASEGVELYQALRQTGEGQTLRLSVSNLLDEVARRDTDESGHFIDGVEPDEPGFVIRNLMRFFLSSKFLDKEEIPAPPVSIQPERPSTRGLYSMQLLDQFMFTNLVKLPDAFRSGMHSTAKSGM